MPQELLKQKLQPKPQLLKLLFLRLQTQIHLQLPLVRILRIQVQLQLHLHLQIHRHQQQVKIKLNKQHLVNLLLLHQLQILKHLITLMINKIIQLQIQHKIVKKLLI